MAKSIYKADDVANFFIELANRQFVDEGGIAEGITNLKLQKLLYFAQVAHLAIYDKRLFKENIEAWKFGPVIPSVYHKYKKFKNSLLPNSSDIVDLPTDVRIFLESIWNIYGKYSAAELVDITHNHGPWKEIYLSGKKDNVMDEKLLTEYYKGLFITKNDKRRG